MKTRDGFIQGYNAQAAVDATAQVIVAHGLDARQSDQHQWAPVADAIEANLGKKPTQLSADAGYCSDANLAALEEREIDAYIAPGRAKHAAEGEAGGARVAAMRAKIKAGGHASPYRLRKQLPEPVFGQIKQARGFRQFLLRGVEKVAAEWGLVCLAHNILKLARRPTPPWPDRAKLMPVGKTQRDDPWPCARPQISAMPIKQTDPMGRWIATSSGRVRLRTPTLETSMPTVADRHDAPTAIQTNLAAIFISLELSRSIWLITSLSPGFAGKMSKHSVQAGDVAALLARVSELKRKASERTGKSFPIVVIQEAGLDGFWLHRVLQSEGIESHVVDPASIPTSRRRRRAKTDRIDGETLFRALLAFKRGEPRVCAMVKAPTPEEEDRRRLSRERKTLVAERSSTSIASRDCSFPGRLRLRAAAPG